MTEYHPNLDGPAEPIGLAMDDSGNMAVRSSELVMLRLIAKWRQHAKDATRDLSAAIDCASRTRLTTEARILERCARQLEQGMAQHNR